MSREMRDLQPVDGKCFRFYCCGPTVYGPAHIGNFRTFVLQDILRRTLEVGGLKTKHVRNITDVDDKTIRDSQAAGEGLREFTARWVKRFHEDCEKLNCLPPHVEPSAVEHIPQQIAMIETLIAKGNAYASGDGSVYFRISSFPEYGRLARLDRQDLDLGKTQDQRADADEYEKDSICDFVLWKGRRPEDGENHWSSPWGEGRPGWHLECSAMTQQYLGDTFDLHSGGVDLVFPHHENEIAQSRCACGGEFARHWFHGTHLLVDGGKMSKSLGNLYTVSDLEERGFTPMEIRYVLIGGHYRKPVNFTFDSLHAAREALAKLARGERDLARAAGEDAPPAYREVAGLDDLGVFAPALAALQDDLNTAEALGRLFTGLRTAADDHAATNWRGFHAVLAALGLRLPSLEVDVPDEIRALAEKRGEARADKDWAASDALRDELLEKGWLVKDSRDGYELEKA
ncbi:MAG: cysteine--tRNA ligase [Akkermansiaceae bacterium]|nr:cysteine--tRNA ligase [Akkermansiaceae bacterium]NNM30000.1 cysteine--tRNA ligase [Akkermansiaceae bacterium]